MALAQYEPILEIVERGAMPLTPDARFLVLRSRVARHLRSHRLELASLPEVATALLSLPDRTARRVTTVARSLWHEPDLADQTLTVLHSPWYAAPGSPRSSGPAAGSPAADDLRTAIYRVGVHEVRNVYLALALRREVFDVLDLEDEGNAAWRHALATAIAAHELAQSGGVVDPDRAFLAGLFHNVGYGTVLKASAQVCRLYLTRADWRESHVRAVAAELQAEVGAFVARRWRLDDGMLEGITASHAPETARVERPLVKVVATARAAAVGAGITPWPSGAPVYGAPPLVLLPSPDDLPEGLLGRLPLRVRAFAEER